MATLKVTLVKTTVTVFTLVATLLAMTIACGGNQTPAAPTPATTPSAAETAAAKKAQADAETARQQALVDSMNAQQKLAYAAATAQLAALSQAPVTSPDGSMNYVQAGFTPTPTAPAPVASP